MFTSNPPAKAVGLFYMEWSPEQGRALDAVAEWFRGPEQLFYLEGHAGTGKTTLARHFAEGVNGLVLFGAYTGKAAFVMRQKGCLNATTIHKLIYVPKNMSEARLKELDKQLEEVIAAGISNGDPRYQELRKEILEEESNLKRPRFGLNLDSDVKRASLTILDECSMIDERMGEDLLSFGKKILVLGDSAQLPPVGGAGYFTNRNPDFRLQEIHRQAKDSPIIHLATEARLGKRLTIGQYGTSEVIPWAGVTRKLALSVDQILVGVNKFRHETNSKMRTLLGRTSPFPETGDRVVCLKNDHEIGLLNGSLWTIETSKETDFDPDKLEFVISPEDDPARRIECIAHKPLLLGEEVPFYYLSEAQQFNYGYAMTAHKAQGSQWDNVLLYDQSRVFRQDARKWLYTAITRAAERITIAV